MKKQPRKMDKADEMPEISPGCSNFVEEYERQSFDHPWMSLKSCDNYLKLVSGELQKRQAAQRILQKQIKDLSTQQLFFLEQKEKFSSADVWEKSKTSEDNIYTDPPAGKYRPDEQNKNGKLASPQPTYTGHNALVSADFTPPGSLRSDDPLTVTPVTDLPKVPPRLNKESSSPKTEENLYNPLPLKSPENENIYARDSGKPLHGLQCIVTKDFSAESPSEIDLYVHDWVELDKVDGNRYYGSVFGRSGNSQGWFHKSHVKVIPDSKVGSLAFRYVVEAQVDYSTDEEGYFSFHKGDRFDVLEENIFVKEDNKHWYYRLRNKSGKIGLAIRLCFMKCQGESPVLHTRSWYHPNMSRVDSEEKLRKSKPNTFLIRDSSHALGNFTISMKGEDKVYHVIVITHIRGYCVRQKNFKSFDEILDFHRAYPIVRSVLLINPFSQDDVHFYQNVTHDLTRVS